MKESGNGIVAADLCEVLGNLSVYKPTMQNEVRLNLALVPIEDDSSLPRFKQFDEFIRLGNDFIQLKRDIMKVKYDFFQELYFNAWSLSNGSSDYITALKMHFGFKNGGVTLIFQPLFTYLEGTTYKVLESSAYYLYDDSNHTYTSTKVFPTQLVTNYRNIIRVKHPEEEGFNRFVDRHDVHGDVKAVIYPFQSIFALINDNILDRDDCISIRNCLATDNTAATETIQQRHSVVLIASKWKKETNLFLEKYLERLPEKDSKDLLANLVFDMRDKFANRSHLCPPGCNEIYDYKIESAPYQCP